MNVLYFFVIYRVYLNCNAKLTADLQVINYRYKILQQCYSNTDFFVWKLSFKEKQGTIKEKLSFQSMSIGRDLFTKIE